MFELVGVGVSNPAKVGKDAGELAGLDVTTGVLATDDVDALVALRPDALVHYGPTAQFADENIRVMSAFLRAGIDVCSTAMTPWVWPTMTQNPSAWIDPITEACEAGGASCFTTGVDPGFANDLFPMTLMGLCGRVDSVRASELVDYTDYEGDYEDEMGIGRPPEFTPLLEIPDLLIMAWGATVPMMASAVGIELDDITTTWEKWVTPEDRKTVKGVVEAGNVAAIRFTINGVFQGREVITLEHVNRIGLDAAPEWPAGSADDVYRVDIDGLAVHLAGDRVPLHRRHRPRPGRRRLPGDRHARAQRRTRRQRPARRLGHRARPAARPRRRHHPLTRRVYAPGHRTTRR